MEKNIVIITNDKVLDVVGLPDTMTYTVERKPDKYNGWKNYATWRINLEIFDGNDWKEEQGSFGSISDLADTLEQRAQEAITGYGELRDDHLAVSYANAFLDDVDYYEIAQSILDQYPKLINVKDRLEYLRGEIKAERISYGEIAELQSLSQYIDKNDVELLEWAGVKEHGND